MNARIRLFALLAAIFCLANAVYAQDTVDEDQLFADTSSVTQTPMMADTQKIGDYSGMKSVGISGTITSAAMVTANREIREKATFENTGFASWISGDILFDVRLKEGVKAFTSMEVTYQPGAIDDGNDTNLSYSLPEFFIDANYQNKLYFRTGKQVLQWGRCYLWNPTDMVNIEQKQFIQNIGLREGTYGVKLHLPSGVSRNIYGFLGTNDVKRPDQISLAAKYEFLMGGSEMSFSVWGKRHYNPVYGYDLSLRLFGIDISGELGLHQRYHANYISGTTGLLTAETKNWVPRSCLSFSRSYTVGGIKDRLTVTDEVYYNNAGNTDRTMEHVINSVMASEMPEGSEAGVTYTADIKGALVANGLYQPNSYSLFYTAVFVNYTKFIIPDLTLNLNTIGNLNQRCFIVTTELSYNNLNDFSLKLSINSFLGPNNTEYTMSNDGLQIQLNVGLSF